MVTGIEEGSIIELASELRYPYSEKNDLYYNSVQNSRRGDFCDGATWYAEHAKPLWPRMYESLAKVYHSYIPDDAEDVELFNEIKEILEQAQKIGIRQKKFDKPTYPINCKRSKRKAA